MSMIREETTTSSALIGGTGILRKHRLVGNVANGLRNESWKAQMVRLFQLRCEQVTNAQCAEIDSAVEFELASIPLKTRQMKLKSVSSPAPAASLVTAPVVKGRKSFCCQTSPPIKTHQTQTPVYTAHKRTRAEMENVELASKIRTQLAHESQHVILPATGEYLEMPPVKKMQIVNILNAIVSTYEEIVENQSNENDFVTISPL